MLNIKLDALPLTALLSNIEKKQLPFATAKALTLTAKTAKAVVDDQLPKVLDRPTPFTRRAIGIKSATKVLLQSEVFIKDKQAEYLRFAVHGGTRRAKGRAIASPGSKMRLNKYGNMTRNKVKKLLLNKKKYFSGKPRGFGSAQAGVWQRMGKGGRAKIRLVVEYHKTLDYKKRLPFYKLVDSAVNQSFHKYFSRAFRDAVRSAKK